MGYDERRDAATEEQNSHAHRGTHGSSLLQPMYVARVSV